MNASQVLSTLPVTAELEPGSPHNGGQVRRGHQLDFKWDVRQGAETLTDNVASGLEGQLHNVPIVVRGGLVEHSKDVLPA